jgi:hypothetical protein
MVNKLTIKFEGLCVFNFNGKDAPLTVLFPDARKLDRSRKDKRFFVHVPIVAFNTLFLDPPDQKKGLDYMKADGRGAIWPLMHDDLALSFEDNKGLVDTELVIKDEFRASVPDINQIYKNRKEVKPKYLDTDLHEDLIARMRFDRGVLSASAGDNVPTYKFETGLTQKISDLAFIDLHTESDHVTLYSVKSKESWRLNIKDNTDVELTIKNMPPDNMIANNEFEPDFDFELLYRSFEMKDDVLHIPSKQLSGAPSGGRPGVACARLAVYN